MNLEPQTVSGAVPERLAQSMTPEHGACGGIHVGRGDTRSNHIDGRLLGFANGRVHPGSIRTSRTYGNSPAQIAAVSVQDAAKVQHDQITTFESPVSGAVMRQRRMWPGCDDRIERHAVETGPA